MKARLRGAGVPHNDYVFGFNDTGRMTQARVLGFLGNLPEGVTEMYFHAATQRWPEIAHDLAAYELEEEFAALVSPRTSDAVRAGGASAIAFRDLADER
jgi:hypothetical protein